MRKIIYLFVILLSVFTIDVNAASVKVGDDTAEAGAINRSVTVELDGDDITDYCKVTFSLTISGTAYAELGTFNYTETRLNKTGSLSSGITISASSGEYLYAVTLGNINYSTTSNLNSDFKIVPTNVHFYKYNDDETSCSEQVDGSIEEGTITYSAPKSTDATLTSLTVSKGSLSPEFSSDVTEYSVTVADTINTIKISATAATGATRTGTGTQTLVMGKNEFEIVVTAEDGTTTKTYTVVVNRGETEEPSALLSSLEIDTIGVVLDPTFDSEVYSYTALATSDITTLNLKYETIDEDATVKVEGNENFVVGENTITITVTSSDESDTKTYEIVVTVSELESEESTESEEEQEKKSSLWLIILIIVIVVLIIAGVAFLLFKKKKNKEPKDKDNDNNSSQQKEEENLTQNTEVFENTSTYDKNLFSENSNTNEDMLEQTKEYNFEDL